MGKNVMLGKSMQWISLTLLAGFVMGAATLAGMQTSDRAIAATDSQVSVEKPAPTATERWAVSDFPTNSKGLTYGSDAEATSYDNEPDLIAVVGDSGIAGFVLKRDLRAAEPRVTSPEQALEWQRRLDSGFLPEPLDVWDLEMTRRVDTYSLSFHGSEMK